MAATSTPLLTVSDCIAQFSAEPHYDDPDVLTYISVTADHPTLGRLGELAAFAIDRRVCRNRGDFLEILDEESQELSDFAVKLFDKFGRIKPELVDNVHKRGTGVWGRDLEEGKLLYITDVNVLARFRRQGVGSFLLQKLAYSEHAPDGTTLVVWPSPMEPAKGDAFKRLRDIAVAFFHKNGFRRIGRTSFMAFATDPSHPSRSLAAEDDAKDIQDDFPEPAEPSSNAHAPSGNGPSEGLTGSLLNPENHLHSIMATSGILGFDASVIEDIVRDTYLNSPDKIRRRDDMGFTPIHIAASFTNLPAVRALLSLPPECGISEDLTSRDNVELSTPLEVCEQRLRDTREFTETLVGSLPGGSDDSGLRVLYLLKRAAGEDVGDSEDDFVHARRYGCTCGQCTEGWLSPRMRYRLITTAFVEADVMTDTVEFTPRGESLAADLLSGTEHLPRDVQGRIRNSKRFYYAYATVVRSIAQVLRQPGSAGIPVAGMVIATLASGASDYFAAGAEVAHALDYVLSTAMVQSPLGDRTWDEIEEDGGHGDDDGVPYASRPTCANDLNFALVAERLGVSPLTGFGYGATYGDEEDDSEMDEDEEDEDIEM